MVAMRSNEQMLRCGSDVLTDESGELCQHTVCCCTDGSSNNSVDFGLIVTKGRNEGCDALEAIYYSSKIWGE